MNEHAGPDPDAPLLSYTVGRLDRAVRRRLHGILAPFRLTIAQFTTLSVLKRRPGLSNAQLARRALIVPQSMLQVITSLESAGLVQREPDPAHQRVLRARLTPAGDALTEQAERATRAFEAQLAASLGGDPEIERAIAILQRLLDEIAQLDQPPAP